MNLLDIVNRPGRPAPWSEGDNIPWNEPGFSERMLKEHLSQDHDAASRRTEIIDAHVRWIHQDLLGGKPSRILDLGCGPGFYMHRLAKLGHSCVGVDYGPASLDYARETADHEGLDCTFHLGDLREADYGSGYDLVMQIYGELNVFRPADAGLILHKAYAALKDKGLLLMEVEDYASVRNGGHAGSSWYSSPSGLFSPEPHFVLEECFWDESAQVRIVRMYMVDAKTGTVTLYSLSGQAYTDEDYTRLFEQHGFDQVQFLPGMGADMSLPRGTFFPILACKSCD